MKTALATLLRLGCALTAAKVQSSPQLAFEVASIRLAQLNTEIRQQAAQKPREL